jgi:hypothetical protein
MFRLNLKIALRNLLRNKGFTLINIGGLAIGMSCCMVLLLYVNYEWSYDKQYRLPTVSMGCIKITSQAIRSLLMGLPVTRFHKPSRRSTTAYS